MMAVLIAVTCLSIRERFNDPDFWWHLKTGELIWNSHRVPTIDTFSYSAFGHPWIAHEWLSEVFLYAMYHAAGFHGVAVWFAVVSALLVSAGYALCLLLCQDTRIAALGGTLIWLFSTVGLGIRPHLLGYTLLIAELLILHLGSRRPRWFFALPALFALWANVHASCLLGLGILICFTVVSFVSVEVGLVRNIALPARVRIRLCLATALSGAALLLNPFGWRLIAYPFDVTMNQPVNMAIIEEWQRPDLTDLRGTAMLAVSAAILLLPLLRNTPVLLFDLALASLGFLSAVRHVRMTFVFGILAVPVLCRLLSASRPRKVEALTPSRPVLDALLAAACFFICVFALPTRTNIQDQIAKSNPVGAVEFVRRSKLSGHMWNEYGYGGYLIWAMPEHKVFVDGRADMFEPAGVMREYSDWLSLRSAPELLDRYHVNFCLLRKDSRNSYLLSLLPHWKRAYVDASDAVYLRQP